jgi:alkaline phosphatase D
MNSANGEGPVRISRRDAIAGTVALGAMAATSGLYGETDPPQRVLGPILGHTDAEQSVVWMRVLAPGEYVLEVTPLASERPLAVRATANDANDFCLHWKVAPLQPATSYRYRVVHDGQPIAGDAGHRFTTPPPPDTPAKVRLAISSCAKEDRGSRDVWERMAAEDVDAIVLIGDTPYIDSTKLEVQTRRHREFAAVPEYQRLLHGRPCWWTWDDHDFAGNDADGQALGKENSRLVYSRYRPQINYGDGHGGIYTSFRHGPVEMFLIDTRWYSRAEPSFADSAKATLLGEAQWEWLKKGLSNSTAPFKLLASGMIWDDKESSESDDWGTYLHERRALEKFIASKRTPGVILVGGDIHASRVLRYKTRQSIGYDLLQFIASPIHSSVIPSLNVYHPNLVRSAVEPHVFLLLEADSTATPAKLSAELVNRHGDRVFTYNLDQTELTPSAGSSS